MTDAESMEAFYARVWGETERRAIEYRKSHPRRGVNNILWNKLWMEVHRELLARGRG